MKHYYAQIPSPVGKLTLIANEKNLVAVLWEEEKRDLFRFSALEKKPNHPPVKIASKQLKEYFAGTRNSFEIPFEFQGTPFQKCVWKALSRIPYGETRSYSDIAREIKSPKACRAVGMANSKNPISIIVPCHRVIGSNGKLTGFAGGLKSKQTLLELERR